MALGGLTGFGIGALVGNTMEKEEDEVKRESYAMRGLGIGTLSGLLAGGGLFLASTKTSCAGAGDEGDCKAIRGIIGVAALTGMPVVGGLTGLLIGSTIKKDVSVAPAFSYDGKNTLAGLFLNLPF